MKHVVMGTAGHVDHGKTVLVKKLTGIDTDRLKQEKQRGITIELGFAPLKLPGGKTVSIVDVPGHEKFIKTMVAGAVGIDFVVLVIAADEGIMPQTKEHMEILSMLGVNMGIVAITKIDTVKSDWLQLVKEDTKQVLKGTPMENFPFVEVSAVTGEGIENLKLQISKLYDKAADIVPSELFRMYTDRVFTLSGYGTITTGTVSGGTVKKGREVEILPEGITARIRGIQVHGSFVEKAGAGDRCALNPAGIDKDDIKRGDVVALPGTITPVNLVDSVLYTVKGAQNIEHNQRVRIHIGTKEVFARLRLIGEDIIPENGKGYVQVRFEEPVCAIRGDKFIIRSYSPLTTIGGGKVIMHNVPNRKRLSEDALKVLEFEDKAKDDEIVQFVLNDTAKIHSVDDLWNKLYIPKKQIKEILDTSVVNGNVIKLNKVNKYIGKKVFNEFVDMITKQFGKMYKIHPFRYKMDKEEIRSKIFADVDVKTFTALIEKLSEKKVLTFKGNFVMEKGKSVISNIGKKRKVHLVEKAVLNEGINVRKFHKVMEDEEINESEDIAEYLVDTGKFIYLTPELLIHIDIYQKAVKKIKSIIRSQGKMTIGEIRDCLDTGRKNAIALAEYLDKKGITKREGNIRLPGPKFN